MHTVHIDNVPKQCAELLLVVGPTHCNLYKWRK